MELFDRSEVASMGGIERSKKLSKRRRSEIARQGGLARSYANLPQALCAGRIEIAGRNIACAVLDTKLRVLTQETFLTSIGRAGKAKGGQGSEFAIRVGGLPPFLAADNLAPFISDELRQAATPIVFLTAPRTGRPIQRAYGYDAKLLPLVCEVYLNARDAHLKVVQEWVTRTQRGEQFELKSILLPSQAHIVEACDLLIRGIAKDGIIALIDRATGYHEQEARDEIEKILTKYIAPHLMPWIKRFSDEFFQQIYRIYGWNYTPGSVKRPQCVGNFINEYIYDQLPPGVKDKLQELNPVTETGRRRWKNTQFLTEDTGNIHLDRQLTSTTTVLRLSKDPKEFKELFYRAHAPRLEESSHAPLVIEVDPGNQLPLFPDLAKKRKG